MLLYYSLFYKQNIYKYNIHISIIHISIIISIIYISQSDSFRNSGNKSVRGNQILKEPNEIPSNLKRGALPEPHQTLENMRRRNINQLIFAQLDINSLRNKFESPQHIIKKNIDVLLISETKIDSSFPSAQVLLK